MEGIIVFISCHVIFICICLEFSLRVQIRVTVHPCLSADAI